MARILWADDEITSLKPHIIFLENKEHEVLAVNSGNEAIEEFKKNSFDIVFLDENMPGMSGLMALEKIKKIQPNVPIIMITKSEELLLRGEILYDEPLDKLDKLILIVLSLIIFGNMDGQQYSIKFLYSV